MIPITSPETLGKALRHYRKLQGLSQTEAGSKFNLTQTMVSNLESGVGGVQMSTVFRYMSALGLEMSLSPRTKASDEEALW